MSITQFKKEISIVKSVIDSFPQILELSISNVALVTKIIHKTITLTENKGREININLDIRLKQCAECRFNLNGRADRNN